MRQHQRFTVRIQHDAVGAGVHLHLRQQAQLAVADFAVAEIHPNAIRRAILTVMPGPAIHIAPDDLEVQVIGGDGGSYQLHAGKPAILGVNQRIHRLQ